MKVEDLIKLLKEFDPKLDVQFGHNYGDRIQTIVTSDVEEAQVAEVAYSDYHQSDRLIDDDNTHAREQEKIREVLLLQ